MECHIIGQHRHKQTGRMATLEFFIHDYLEGIHLGE